MITRAMSRLLFNHALSWDDRLDETNPTVLRTNTFRDRRPQYAPSNNNDFTHMLTFVYHSLAPFLSFFLVLQSILTLHRVLNFISPEPNKIFLIKSLIL